MQIHDFNDDGKANTPGKHEDTNAQRPDGLLNKKGMARKIGKSCRTVDDWMAKGWLPHLKIGRSVLFDWPLVKASLLERFGVSR